MEKELFTKIVNKTNDSHQIINYNNLSIEQFDYLISNHHFDTIESSLIFRKYKDDDINFVINELIKKWNPYVDERIGDVFIDIVRFQRLSENNLKLILDKIIPKEVSNNVLGLILEYIFQYQKVPEEFILGNSDMVKIIKTYLSRFLTFARLNPLGWVERYSPEFFSEIFGININDEEGLLKKFGRLAFKYLDKDKKWGLLREAIPSDLIKEDKGGWYGYLINSTVTTSLSKIFDDKDYNLSGDSIFYSEFDLTTENNVAELFFTMDSLSRFSDISIIRPWTDYKVLNLIRHGKIYSRINSKF